MTLQFDYAQKLGKDSFDKALKTFGIASTGTQAIVAETATYAKKSLELGTQTFEKLVGAGGVGKAIEIQTDYFKRAHASFLAQSTKMNELYAKLAKDALAPSEYPARAKAAAPAK